jgi:hypothetical protein
VVVCSFETPMICPHSVPEYLAPSWGIAANLISVYYSKKEENDKLLLHLFAQ